VDRFRADGTSPPNRTGHFQRGSAAREDGLHCNRCANRFLR